MQAFIATTFVLFSSIPSITIFAKLDTITPSHPLTSNQTLVSADQKFELGFFNPENSQNQYLGIWFKKLYPIEVVWVANRAPSLPKNTKGAFELTTNGVLTVLNDNKTILWSSNTSRSVQNPVAQLLTSGNLVIRDENDHDPENYLWQSLDYPSNTLIAGFKIGIVRSTGLDRFLTSWKTPKDPSPGNYTIRMLSLGYPQLVLSQGSVIKRRVGPWNGVMFSGTQSPKENELYKFMFVLNDKEVYYSFELLNSSILGGEVLRPQGVVQHYVKVDPEQSWAFYVTSPTEDCDAYALCGAYGVCNGDNAQLCQCLGGFVPKFDEEWERGDWSGGCVRRSPLNCSGDVFLKYSGVKFPDTQKSWFNATVNLEECRLICKKNCSCTAFANLDIRKGGSGCLLWFGDLLDMSKYKTKLEIDICIRTTASEALKSIGEVSSRRKNKKHVPIIVSLVLTGILLGPGLIIYIFRKIKSNLQDAEGDFRTKMKKKGLDLPLFDFTVLASATNNFSIENKLGQGGFGPVYKVDVNKMLCRLNGWGDPTFLLLKYLKKVVSLYDYRFQGILKENQEIAVKRLSKNSNQGLDEFRNEVICIAKLQHRNLVKLMGCCIQQEKMLVYEYMPNQSLDFFIFNEMQRRLLNWQKRFHIIDGIARGLLYLHQDSRLRIVHRDLKASNVLLDHDMNPKISDFGLARSFGGNETEANTKRVVGTYGYMSPEYVIDGIFSVKSDVFSYGVLLLEIVTGKKNRGFYHPDHYHNLLGHAWKMFKEGRSEELVDEFLEKSINLSEISRSIHVSLLCVQRSPEDRPSMSVVVLMLGSDNPLPEPKEPGFFTEREVSAAETFSNNEITRTILSAR